MLIAVLVVLLVFLIGGVALPLMAQGQSFPTTGVVTTEDDRLNLRAAPSADAEITGKIEPQTEIEVLGVSDDGGWYEVEVAGVGSGWVSAEWVRLGNAPTEIILLPTPTPNPNSTGSSESTTNTDSSQSDTDSSSEVPIAPRRGVVAVIAGPADLTTNEGDTATGAAAAADEDDTGTTASDTTADNAAAADEATSTDEADVEPAAQATPSAAPTVPTAIVQPERMNVRGGPGTSFAVVGSAAQGNGFEITGVTPAGDWYRINFADAGGTGWLFVSLVQVVGPAEAIPALSQEELPAAPTPDPQAAVQAVAAAPPIVSAPPPSGAGFFGYGVQAHMLGGEVGRSMDAVSNMGFNWIKQQVQWKLFAGEGGGGSFGDVGAIVNEAGARGINVLLSVVDAPGWAREPGFDGSVGGPPADPATYAAYVGGMAASYCGTALKAIEVWNEQNLHYEWGNKPLDPAEYMRLLQAAYASIKQACPSMLVISGALTPAGSNPPFAMDDFAYLEGMYQNGLANYSDGIGAHPSGYNVPATVRFEEACATIQQTGNSFNGACDTPHHSWSFRSTMEGYRNIMNVYGDSNKRIWPTEFGWAAGGAFDPRYAYANDNSFEEQAQWTVEAYTMMREWGWVGPAFLWNLNFRVVADGTEKAQWGIVGNDWTPLPVYNALKGMPK
jgi:uncharacterized protein YgiM (DUF1202 family)